MKLLILVLGLSFFITSASFGKQVHKHPHHKSHKHGKGLKRNPEKFKKFKQAAHKKHAKVDVAVPAALDISALVSLPENQQSCGCCWAFSLSKAMRSELMVAGKDPGVLEFNYLINNCGPGTKEDGCNGGDFPAADNFLNAAGPNLDKNDPFTAQDGGRCPGLPVLATAANYQMLGTDSSGPTFQDLAQALNENHMVSIDVAAGAGDWENYGPGIYPNDVYDACTGGPSDIDHMIDLVGYDCETSVDANGKCVFNASGKPVNGDGFLILENNWGEDWGVKAGNGHAGYMKSRMYDKRGRNCNAVANDALIFQLGSAPAPIPPIPPAPPAPCENCESKAQPTWVLALIGLSGLVVGLGAAWQIKR